MRACVAGWGTAVPDGRLTNIELEGRVDTSDAWIVERTGIRERRVARPEETTASQAIEAGAAAIKQAGISPLDVDLLIVATATPEQPIPHTGAFVGDGLGLHCGSFDLGAGCAGFVYELVTGSALLTSGGLEHVLIVGAEVLSRIIDPTDRTTAVLFGDGAAALVLEAGAQPDGPGLLAFDLGCDGSLARLLEIPAGGSRLPTSVETLDQRLQYLKMQGPEVFRRAVRTVVDSANAALERAGMASSEVDWFIPHQANARIIDAAAHRLGISPERTIVNIDRYGNTSAASIPLALAEAADAGDLHHGQVVLFSGFGAGMTWGSAVLRWGRA
jgi:3-oxoacyl-[acyl-carrier-protein] synthase-3